MGLSTSTLNLKRNSLDGYVTFGLELEREGNGVRNDDVEEGGVTAPLGSAQDEINTHRSQVLKLKPSIVFVRPLIEFCRFFCPIKGDEDSLHNFVEEGAEA